MMARKSRKHIENSAVPTCSLNLRTAAYLRISEVKPGLPPESIENQLKIIEEYLNCRSDLTLVATYMDINVSGRSFQREGFRQMIEAIESGKIDCVIVKDECDNIELKCPACIRCTEFGITYVIGTFGSLNLRFPLRSSFFALH